MNKINNLVAKIIKEKSDLVHLFSEWDATNDARITVFSKLINVCNSTQLSLIFYHVHLTNKDWWKQIMNDKISKKDIKICMNEHIMFTKLAFIHFSFSSIESAFRLYVRSLDGSACKNGTSDFKSIYSWLLKRTKLQAYETLLDLLRLVRNTVHNNGVYFSKSGLNESLNYNGKVYNFNHGSKVEFMTWELVYEIISEVQALVAKVVKSREVSNIKLIEDPFANNTILER